MKCFPVHRITQNSSELNTQLCCVIPCAAVNACPLYFNPSCSGPVDVTADVRKEPLVSIICLAVKEPRQRQEDEKKDE